MQSEALVEHRCRKCGNTMDATEQATVYCPCTANKRKGLAGRAMTVGIGQAQAKARRGMR